MVHVRLMGGTHMSLSMLHFISGVGCQTLTLVSSNSTQSWLHLEFWSGAASYGVGDIPNRPLELKNTNRELYEGLTCRRGTPGGLNGGESIGLGRPAWVACCTTRLYLSLVHSMLLCCFVSVCSTGLHRPNSLVHSFACTIESPT
jgi:hypothetical protein